MKNASRFYYVEALKVFPCGLWRHGFVVDDFACQQDLQCYAIILVSSLLHKHKKNLTAKKFVMESLLIDDVIFNW